MDKAGIVDTSLRIAEQAGSWDKVHLHDIAQVTGMTLGELCDVFPTKDEIAEAFFDGADAAMLNTGKQPGWATLTPEERVGRLVMAWLDALAPHKKLVPGMLAYKLHPEHVHLASRGVERISRTVQTLRECALFTATGLRREAEEAALTSIYLATFTYWTSDSSVGSERTRKLLAGLLKRAGAAAQFLRFAKA